MKQFSAIILFIGVICASSAPLKTNLVIVSAGSWMVFSGDERRSYFNKGTVTLYSSGKMLRRVIALPTAYTVSTKPGSIATRLSPGDLDMYFAIRLGWLEPRLGIEVPCGYGVADVWKKRAWIGSNNIRIQTGFSISRTNFEQIGLPFGLEAMASFAVTDDNSHYKTGSLSTQLYIKSSKSLFKKITLGGELSVYGKSVVWTYDNLAEHGITLMPTASCSYRISRRWYSGVKMGFGPSFSLGRNAAWKSNAMDAGMSLLYFP